MEWAAKGEDIVQEMVEEHGNYNSTNRSQAVELHDLPEQAVDPWSTITAELEV